MCKRGARGAAHAVKKRDGVITETHHQVNKHLSIQKSLCLDPPLESSVAEEAIIGVLGVQGVVYEENYFKRISNVVTY